MRRDYTLQIDYPSGRHEIFHKRLIESVNQGFRGRLLKNDPRIGRADPLPIQNTRSTFGGQRFERQIVLPKYNMTFDQLEENMPTVRAAGVYT